MFTPLAIPARRTSTAASTVAVSGATSSVIPQPSTVTAGSTSAQYEASGPIRSISSTPAAQIIGPRKSGSRGPIARPSRPARLENASISTVIGTRATPATSGVKPDTTCSCTVSSRKMPLNAPYTQSVTRFTEVNSRDENSSRGSIGSAARRSASTNATPNSTPSSPATGANGRLVSVSAYVTPASASAASTAPSTSNRPERSGSRVSGTWRADTAITTTATGRLSRKIHRQPGPSTSHPPRNGPTAAATPPSPDQAPTAAPRSSAWNTACSMASEPGVSSAPPTPCSARAAISTSMFGAAAQNAEATANQATPIRNTRRRPYRSPSEPPSRISAASVSR
ncbi:hypothetical protein BX265_5879 [Streptomyces sp. TLI_235]|nr:hypothetical protein BX265_5879 [Streptomyces sp. TLI_235]